ncbi:MAG: hypothetical protein I3274_02630 [Candidatus Moeniiplasma glomeromycotorum]|nr:hypothetical protein [Candidatus Moeniiplasma glomeromycotorum]MCE8167500.1 hypothetical protein [Candidatus Moeniiplasma glomeromycotorum]
MTSSFIAQLKAKYCRSGKTKYWILEIYPHPALTRSLGKLLGNLEKGSPQKLLNTQPPKNNTFFLFGEKVRWASSLQLNQDYYWIYKEVCSSRGQKLYQIQDWKLLGEPKTVRRMSQLLKKHEISV